MHLEVQVLSNLCVGEEACARCSVLIHQRASVRAELKLLSAAALCSHNFKIRTPCQPLTYSCVQGLGRQITIFYVTQGNQYCLTLFLLEQGSHQ